MGTPEDVEEQKILKKKQASNSVNQLKKAKARSVNEMEIFEDYGFPMDLNGFNEITLDNLTISEDLFYYNNNLRYKQYEKEK